VKTADPAAAELAEISALLEPWLWVSSCGQPYHALPVSMATGPYRFEGAVKPDLSKMTRGTPGRVARTGLIERAEEGIAALEAAGWLLMHDLHMEITSRIAPFTQTLGGELAERGECYEMVMTVRFEVNRPR